MTDKKRNIYAPLYACDAMKRYSWWAFYSAFYAIVIDIESLSYYDFQRACEGGIVFG